MKLLICFAVLCVVACAAQRRNFGGGHSVGRTGHSPLNHRFRREPFRREPYVRPNVGRPPIKIPGTPPFNPRYRRSPQGSIMLQGTQPLSGPNRQPSLDINYNHRIIDNDRTKLDAFGGANLQSGHLTPQAGFGVEHRFKNDIFVHGQGQVQPRPGGGFEPSFGAGLGWRFRREAEPYEEEEAVEEMEPCSAC